MKYVFIQQYIGKVSNIKRTFNEVSNKIFHESNKIKNRLLVCIYAEKTARKVKTTKVSVRTFSLM